MRKNFNLHFEELITDTEKKLKSYFFLDEECRKYAKILLQAEMVTAALRSINPEDSCIDSIPYFLTSPILPSFTGLSQEKRQILANAQVLFSHMRSKRVFYKLIDKYKEIPKRLCCIEFDKEKSDFKWGKSRLNDESVYLFYLKSYLEHKENEIKYAKGPKVTYIDKRNSEEYSALIEDFMKKGEAYHIDTSHSSREAISFTIKDLKAAAREMDSIEKDKCLPQNDWEIRVEEVIFTEVKKNNISNTSRINIEGIQHWVGKLSVGKTTLMQVIAFLLKKKGLITTLVFKDIVEVYQNIDLFFNIGVVAVPVLSVKNRSEHIVQYSQLIKDDSDFIDYSKKRSLYYLSDVCLLKDYTVNEEISYSPPCFDLNDKRKTKKKKVCPHIHNCEYYNCFHDIPKADIFITTVQSMIHTSLLEPFATRNMRMFEFLLRRSNLIMIDEADKTQSVLDSMLIPDIEITGPNSGWFDNLNIDVCEQLSVNRVPLGNADVSSWVEDLNKAKFAIDRLYWFFQNMDYYLPIKKMIGRQAFTGRKLLQQVALRLCGMAYKEEESVSDDILKVYEEINAELKKFADGYWIDGQGSRSRSKIISELNNLTEGISNQKMQRAGLAKFIENARKKWGGIIKLDEGLITCFQFTLTIIYLERHINNLMQEFPLVRDDLRIDNQDEGRSFFTGIPEDFSGLVPIAPTGIQFGFKYIEDDEGKRSGKLKLYRYLGVGRYILNYMNRIFADLDQTNGAHCVLLSGTSYLPYSSKYNLHLPVKYLIKSKREKSTNIDYEFISFLKNDGKAISISGKYGDNRKKELESAVERITECNTIYKLLKELPTNRKRILLIVGSYEESDIVAKKLKDCNLGMRDRIFALTRDEDEDNGFWQRQRLAEFVKSDGCILVAPLLAVERGHNILVNTGHEKIAAFGAAMYLVRPYPIPFDLTNMANRINKWVLEAYIEKENKKDSISEEVGSLRENAYKLQSEYFKNQRGYRNLSDKSGERKVILSDLYGTTWQLEGRLIRGYVPAKVVFIDASFAPNTALCHLDNEKTSMIIGWKTLWDGIMKDSDKYKAEEIKVKLLKELYEIRITGLNNIKMM